MCNLCDVEWFTQALLLLPPAAGKVLAVLLNTPSGTARCHRSSLPNGNPVLMTQRSVQELARDTRLSRRSVQFSLTLLEEKGLIERKARFKQQNQRGTDPHAAAIFVIPMLGRDVAEGIRSLKAESVNEVQDWQGEHLAPNDLGVQPLTPLNEFRGVENCTPDGDSPGNEQGVQSVAPLNKFRGAENCTPNNGGGDEAGSGEVLIKIPGLIPPHTTTTTSPGDEVRGAEICIPNRASPGNEIGVQPVAPLTKSRGAENCTPNHGGDDEVGSGEVLIKIPGLMPPHTTTTIPPLGDEFRGAKNCTPNRNSPVNKPGVQSVAPLAGALRAMGFTDAVAFVAQHPVERIEAALAYVSDPMVSLKNPPGFLRILVEGQRNIPVPPTVDRVYKQRDPDKYIKGRYGHVVKR